MEMFQRKTWHRPLMAPSAVNPVPVDGTVFGFWQT